MLKLAIDTSRLSLVEGVLCMSQALAEPLIPWPDAKPSTVAKPPTVLVKVTRSADDKGEGVKTVLAAQPYHLKCNITPPGVGGDWMVLLSHKDILLASHSISADAWPADQASLILAIPFRAPEGGHLQATLISTRHWHLKVTHAISN
jgi:hypothetical protein